jgi:hypothetical protein
MTWHCYGAPEGFQADCGGAGPHGEHDMPDGVRRCMGAPEGFEANCGGLGPHDEHDYTPAPRRR